MKQIEILKAFIMKGENKNCTDFLRSLPGLTDNKEYEEAFIRVLLVETVRSLNESVAEFYYDEKELADELFNGENPCSIELVTEKICRRAKTAADINKTNLLKKAKSYILNNFTDSRFSISAAADYVGIAQASLCKLFVRNEGVTPAEFTGKLRIEKSLEFLAYDSVSIAGNKVGFSSQESYIRVFKKYMGETPGSWKRNKLFL